MHDLKELEHGSGLPAFCFAEENVSLASCCDRNLREQTLTLIQREVHQASSPLKFGLKRKLKCHPRMRQLWRLS